MLRFLPSDDELYAARATHDGAFDRLAFDGQVFACASDSGLFCRLGCVTPAAKREHTTFHASAAEALETGFRPCPDCRPLSAQGGLETRLRGLIDAVQTEPLRRWGDADITARGLDPATVRKDIRRHFGVAWPELLRLARPRAANVSQDAQSVLTALCDYLGRGAAELSIETALKADGMDTPIGPMIAIADGTHLRQLGFFDSRALSKEVAAVEAETGLRLSLGRNAMIERTWQVMMDYFAGVSADFDLPMTQGGSPFQQQVWRALCEIPVAETRSYGQMAHYIQQPDAVRALARANGANRLGIVVPCHRVIGADGSLTGYGGGLWRKTWLLAHEKRYFGV